MDVLPRITRQVLELYRQMSALERAISVAVTAVLLFGFGFILIWNGPNELQPLAAGRAFDSTEIAAAEKALGSAGYHAFRRDGLRLLAPAAELEKYNAVLAQMADQSSDLGSQMLKQYETLGPFSTDRQRQQMKEALLLQELRQTIRAVPEIEDARIAIASSERRLSWNEKPRTTANVSVKLRDRREISPMLVTSLKQVVANMVPDLKPADVTIFDVTRGQAYSGDLNEGTHDAYLLQRAREYARQYERQIGKALSHIPNIDVQATVDLETLKSESGRIRLAHANAEPYFTDSRSAADDAENGPHQTAFRASDDEFQYQQRDNSVVAALPKSMQVNVSIPRDYVRDVIAHRKSKNEKSLARLNPERLEDEVLAKVERIVDRMIPPGAPREAATVTFIDSMATETHQPTPSLTAKQLKQWLQKWGGPLAIACIVLILGAFLFRGRRATEVAIEPETEAIPLLQPSPEIAEPIAIIAETSAEAAIDRAAVLRDEVRSLVKSDPVAAASILNQWLSEAAA